MFNKIDHIAIGAANLPDGVAAMRRTLGVDIPMGGKHPVMGTHNCVMQSGNETYVELIAIDPDAPAPQRPRWFTLDDLQTQAKLATGPHALCWVVNTDDLDAVVQASPIDLGEVLSLSRGDLTWRLTVPRDGSLAMGGLVPGFIEWPTGPHPSHRQQDLGVRLQGVTLTHPDPDRLGAILRALAINHSANLRQGPAGLSFQLDSAKGNVILN